MYPIVSNNQIKFSDDGNIFIISNDNQRTNQLLTLPLNEIQSVLIPICAAIFSLIPGYFLGVYMGEKREKKRKEEKLKEQ